MTAPREATGVAGCLSGVRIGDRVFQIQTECTRVPEPRVVTVVMLDGRAVHKRARPAPPAQEDVERLVAQQHAETVQDVRTRLRDRAARLAEDPQAQFERLQDEGLARFLEGDFAAAVEAWEEAQRVDPGNRALSVNLGVARRKRDAAGRAARASDRRRPGG